MRLGSQTNTPNECKLLSVRMDDVRACLGIQEGGELALTAIALLTGGDYHLGGAERVGHKQASPLCYLCVFCHICTKLTVRPRHALVQAIARHFRKTWAEMRQTVRSPRNPEASGTVQAVVCKFFPSLVFISYDVLRDHIDGIFLPPVEAQILFGPVKRAKQVSVAALPLRITCLGNALDFLVVRLLVQGLAVVKHLLRGKQSDEDVLEDLANLLAQSPEEHADVLRHDKCTGASQRPWLLRLAHVSGSCCILLSGACMVTFLASLSVALTFVLRPSHVANPLPLCHGILKSGVSAQQR